MLDPLMLPEAVRLRVGLDVRPTRVQLVQYRFQGLGIEVYRRRAVERALLTDFVGPQAVDGPGLRIR